MAKKRRSKSKRKNPISTVRKQQSFFKASEAKTLEQFVFASIISGAATGIGVVFGNILAKYLLREVDKTVPLPESFSAAIEKT